MPGCFVVKEWLQRQDQACLTLSLDLKEKDQSSDARNGSSSRHHLLMSCEECRKEFFFRDMVDTKSCSVLDLAAVRLI